MQGVTSGTDALALVGNTYFDLAILDADASDLPFVPFTRDLIERQPGLKLLVFPPQNNPHHPVLTGLVANGFLKKPFFTPEVSRALKDIFNDRLDAVQEEPEPINDLAELWIKRPEVGMSRVEQLLGSTSAQTGLLIANKKVIAASGLIEDANIEQVMKLLEAHQLDRDSVDLLRFMTLEKDKLEVLIYASLLIPQITLALFYPATVPIQLVRQEVYQVKQEFKDAYPTTGDLRKELEITTEEPLPAQPDTAPVPEETGNEKSQDLKPLEEEIGPEDLDTVLSAVELKSLDSLLAEMPAPDPESEEEDAEATVQADKLDLSNWFPLPESDDLVDTAGQAGFPLPQDTNTEADFTSEEPPVLVPYTPAGQNEPSAPQEEPADTSFELPWEKANDLPTDAGHNPSQGVINHEAIAAENEDPSFNAWLDELQLYGSEHTKTLDPDATDEHEESALPPPLPQSMFTEESGRENPEFSPIPEVGQTETTGEFQNQGATPEDASVDYLSGFSSDPTNTVEPPEPPADVVALSDFRFQYTCLLIPRDPQCFLAQDLSERLSFLLPQLHLEYGWHLTGIAVRPQYLLWAISLPLDACPVDVIQEIRRRTSTHLLANFPELRNSDPQLDFWAPGYLALSGGSSPSVGMIYDFIKQTRTNQKSKH